MPIRSASLQHGDGTPASNGFDAAGGRQELVTKVLGAPPWVMKAQRHPVERHDGHLFRVDLEVRIEIRQRFKAVAPTRLRLFGDCMSMPPQNMLECRHSGPGQVSRRHIAIAYGILQRPGPYELCYAGA
jgi:hypothetical protein